MAGYAIQIKVRIREKDPVPGSSIGKTIVFGISNQRVMKKVNFLLTFPIFTLLIIK
jgi:hypothetical protein